MLATTFADLLAERARATPDDLMFEETEGRVVTFAEYASAVEALGRQIAPDAVVAWQLATSIDAAVLAGALAGRGASQVPLLPAWRAYEVGFAVDQVNARSLVVAGTETGFDYRAMAESIAGVRPDLTAVHAPIPVSVRFGGGETTGGPLGEPRPGPGNWVFYTSGTTAEPKGVRHTDATIIAAAQGMIDVHRLSRDDRHAVVFPFTHIGGIIWLAVSLLVGLPQLMVGQFDPDETVPAMRRFGVTVAGSGTAFHQAYLRAQRQLGSERLFPAVRIFPGGAAAKPPHLHAQVKTELGGAGIVSAYGLTECPVVSINPPDADDGKLANTEGKAAPGAAIHVVDGKGADLPPHVEGEIRVKGPQLFSGYVDMSQNADAFDERGLFRTGDLGFLDTDGFLTVTGRLKDVIIRKGENVSAKQVEDMLHLHQGVSEVAVVGVPDPVSGERVVAVVAPSDPGRPPGLAELGRFLLEQGLMRQKLPEQLEIVDALPRNPAGKVLKDQLRSVVRSARESA